MNLILETTIDEDGERFRTRELGIVVPASRLSDPDHLSDVARQIRNWIETTEGDGFLELLAQCYSASEGTGETADDDTLSLPAEFEELIQTHYAAEEQPKVRAAILEFGSSESKIGPDLERIWFDILHLGSGDSSRVQSLIETAKRDPRDVMQREYFPRAGKYYPHAWARRHAVNRDTPEPPPVNPNFLAIAESGIRAPARDAHGGQPRLLLLTFSEASKVLTAADKISILSSSADMLDLSPLIEYLPSQFIKPQRTLLRCRIGDGPPTLEYAEHALSWNGSRSYWSECSIKMAGLGKSDVNAQIAFTFGAADQAVLVRLRKSSMS